MMKLELKVTVHHGLWVKCTQLWPLTICCTQVQMIAYWTYDFANKISKHHCYHLSFEMINLISTDPEDSSFQALFSFPASLCTRKLRNVNFPRHFQAIWEELVYTSDLFLQPMLSIQGCKFSCICRSSCWLLSWSQNSCIRISTPFCLEAFSLDSHTFQAVQAFSCRSAYILINRLLINAHYQLSVK